MKNILLAILFALIAKSTPATPIKFNDIGPSNLDDFSIASRPSSSLVNYPFLSFKDNPYFEIVNPTLVMADNLVLLCQPMINSMN